MSAESPVPWSEGGESTLLRVVTIDGFDQPDDRHLAKVAQFLATVVIPVGMVQRERLESHHEFTANASIRQPLEEFVDILHPVHTLLRASPGSGATRTVVR